MSKSSLLVTLTIMICSANPAMASSPSRSPKEVEKWVENLTHKQEKVTKLHFYFHRIGDTTGVSVARANMTTKPPTGFGLVVIEDDPLTLGPELSSAHVGYAQGMSASASLEDVVLAEYFTFVFTDGSALAVLGSNPILHQYREMPIVGGTGVFRLARGLVAYRTYFYNTTSVSATVEVHAVVFHY